MNDVLNFENSIQKETKRIVDEIGGGVYVEIWVGGMRNPAYSLIATKIDPTNNGNAVRIYTADGEIFETSTNNVVMQLLGKEKEKFLPPK
jgi:hypothetical protein